jgi:hypothetical protein
MQVPCIMVNQSRIGDRMVKKSVMEKPKARSGPRAPAGKRPLTVIIDEDLIKDSKIAAIEDGRNVSGIVQELLQGWLAGRKSRK